MGEGRFHGRGRCHGRAAWRAIACVILALTAGTSRSQGDFMHRGTPTVDGVDGGAWAKARVGRVTLETPDPPYSAPVDFFFMNDGTRFYEAMRIGLADLPVDPNRLILWSYNWPAELGFCDPAILTDIPSLTAWQFPGTTLLVEDIHQCDFNLDTDFGGTSDTIGAWSDEGATLFFELSQPLDSSDDLHDLSIAIPALMGVSFEARLLISSDVYSGTLPATVRLVDSSFVFFDDFELGNASRW